MKLSHGSGGLDHYFIQNITALKDDLRIVNTGGRKFLEFIIENGKNFSELNYKSDVPATTEHYGSIIKTGYNGNNKPYTHPLYLNCAWDAGDKKKFKDLMSYLYSNTKRKKNISKGEFKERRRYISDIFYVMHALFPKDSNYKDSPFIKKGADASIIGKKYVDNSTNVLKAPFDVEEKHLTWAN
ncbi:12962_t:CDS:2, partial [Entrophospora sp. SA101]